MVLRIEDRPFIFQLITNELRNPQLVLEPDRHCLQERWEAPGKCRQIGIEKSFEFHKRLVVESDIVHLPDRYARLPKAIVDGVYREFSVMLLPCESLLLSSSNQLTVADQRCSRIVIEARYSKDMHGSTQN